MDAAVQAVKAGRVEFKMDKTGSMAVVIGKRSFSDRANCRECSKSALDAVMENLVPMALKVKLRQDHLNKQHNEPRHTSLGFHHQPSYLLILYHAKP